MAALDVITVVAQIGTPLAVIVAIFQGGRKLGLIEATQNAVKEDIASIRKALWNGGGGLEQRLSAIESRHEALAAACAVRHKE